LIGREDKIEGRESRTRLVVAERTQRYSRSKGVRKMTKKNGWKGKEGSRKCCRVTFQKERLWSRRKRENETIRGAGRRLSRRKRAASTFRYYKRERSRARCGKRSEPV